MHAVAEGEDGGWVPHIRAAGVAAGGVGAKGHVCHGYLVDVVGGVLGDRQSACGCVLAHECVDEGGAAVLAWVASPDDGVDGGG